MEGLEGKALRVSPKGINEGPLLTKNTFKSEETDLSILLNQKFLASLKNLGSFLVSRDIQEFDVEGRTQRHNWGERDWIEENTPPV